jgi:hypothetical protein
MEILLLITNKLPRNCEQSQQKVWLQIEALKNLIKFYIVFYAMCYRILMDPV